MRLSGYTAAADDVIVEWTAMCWSSLDMNICHGLTTALAQYSLHPARTQSTNGPVCDRSTTRVANSLMNVWWVKIASRHKSIRS